MHRAPRCNSLDRRPLEQLDASSRKFMLLEYLPYNFRVFHQRYDWAAGKGRGHEPHGRPDLRALLRCSSYTLQRENAGMYYTVRMFFTTYTKHP